MKKQITVNDNLQEIVDTAIEETKELLLNYLATNDDIDDAPCLHNDLDYDGHFHEIVDSSVPIYTYDIETIWFLHKDKLTEAYENAGIGNNPLENNGMTAIYFYIEQEVCEWYHANIDDIFNDYMNK